MRVQEVMKKDVATISAELPARAALMKMQLHRIRHLIVVSEGKVVGVLSDRDVTEDVNGETVADLMTPKVVAVKPETTVREAANLLRGRTIGCLAVMEKEKLVGILTVTDLLSLLGRGVERPSPRAQRSILRDRGPRKQKRPARNKPAV
jgi:acetoin utilization protein AcuB